jgi:hypothetical protein
MCVFFIKLLWFVGHDNSRKIMNTFDKDKLAGCFNG